MKLHLNFLFCVLISLHNSLYNLDFNLRHEFQKVKIIVYNPHVVKSCHWGLSNATSTERIEDTCAVTCADFGKHDFQISLSLVHHVFHANRQVVGQGIIFQFYYVSLKFELYFCIIYN